MIKNKMRIALIYPPHKVDSLLYSLAYLSNHVKKLSDMVEVLVINCPARGIGIEELAKELFNFNPHIIGVSIPFTNMLKTAVEVLQYCRRYFPKSWLIAGGTHATICPEDLFDKCDFVVLGDGEYVLSEMINNFPDKQIIEKLKGIAFSKNGQMVIQTQDMAWYKNKTFGSPDWGAEDLSRYFSPIVYGTKDNGIGIFSSKGCFYNCTYCNNGLISNRRIINRSLDDVIQEIKFYMENYNLRNFSILDEVFTANEKRVREFCDRIEKERLGISWEFQTRADLVTNKDLFKRMRQAGAVVASIGIESGNENILRTNKSSSREIIKHAVDTFKELGYLVYAGFIIGFPQDTIETVWQTITFSDELNLDSPGFQIMVPYPKTEVRRVAEKEGGILTNDFQRYSTYDVVYIPPGLEGYNLLAIRQFAFQYFHTRNENRLHKWLDRFVDYDNFNDIAIKYRELFSKRDSLNFDYLKNLKLSVENNRKLKAERLAF